MKVFGLAVIAATALVAQARKSTTRMLSKEEFLRAMRPTKAREQPRPKASLHDVLLAAGARRLGNNNNNNAANEWFKSDVDPSASPFDFDMSNYAFKYSGCAAINSFDEDMLQNYGNPMATETYAVFRLCPKNSCNKYSLTGCGKNFGEYVLEMSTYLQAISGFHQGATADYCDACYPCSDQAAVDKQDWLDQCYYTAYQTGYEEYFNAHDGDMSGYNAGYQNQNQNGGGYNYQNNNNGNNNNNRRRRLRRRLDQNGNAQYGYYDEYGNWVAAEEEPDENKGYWGDDGIWYPIEYANYVAEDDECATKVDEVFAACDASLCGGFSQICESDSASEMVNANALDMVTYSSCTAYKNSNGQKVYVAPRCGSDHYTISLGVFSDASCNKYVGEDMSILSEGDLRMNNDGTFTPKECISCDYYDNAVADAERDTYGNSIDFLTGICTGLYSGSAQCDKYMQHRKTNRFSSSSASSVSAEEEVSCSFIENILKGAYDESGEIVLTSPFFNVSDWKNLNQYQNLHAGLSALEIGGLILSFSLMIVLGCMVACSCGEPDDDDDMLLVDDPKPVPVAPAPWKPRRGRKVAQPVGMDPLTLARQNSGIVMGRSQSIAGSTPLI